MSTLVMQEPAALYLCNNKCGEIKMTSDAEQFQLICDYCTQAYAELLDFIKHIKLKECPVPTNKQDHNSDPTLELKRNDQDCKLKIEDDDLPAACIDMPDPLEFISAAIKEEHMNSIEFHDDNNCLTTAIESASTTTKDKERQIDIASVEELSYLIELYKQNKDLWNSSNTKFAPKTQQNKAYTEITKSMNLKFIDEYYNKKKVVSMLNELRWEYAKMHAGETNKLWYYEHLSFLNDVQESSSANCIVKVKRNCSTAKTASTVRSKVLQTQKEDADIDSVSGGESSNEDSDCIEDEDNKSGTFYSQDVTVALLELFKDKRSLWDRADDDFYKYPERRRHYQELADKINARYNLTVHQNEVRKRIQLLMNVHRQNNTTHMYYKYLAFIPKNQKCPFTCQYCGKKFRRQRDLGAHEYSHTNIKEFACAQCDKAFWSVDHLKAHQKIHQPKEQFEYLCDACGERFRTTEIYKKHLYRKHNLPFPHHCEICQHGFIKMSKLKVHMRVHTGEKPYQCTQCDRTFSAKVDLRTHLDRHANRKSHICPTCSKAFCTREELKTHQKIHTNIREHVCEICHKRFTVKNNLKIHKETHSDERKYECKVCGKRFKQASSRAGHMKQHRAEENCGK